MDCHLRFTSMAIPGGGNYKKKKSAPAGAGASLIF